MEYQTYESYETYETDPAYETDAAYDDMYGENGKEKVKSSHLEQEKAKEDDAGKKNLVKISHLEQGKNREGNAGKTNLVTVVLLGLIAILLLVLVVLQIVPLASAGGDKPEVEEAENDKQCSRPYKILSDSWRKIDFNPAGTSNCDNTLDPNWYRFSFDGNASYARIPSNPPAKKHQGTKKPCGTSRVAWMYGSLPTVGEPPKNVTMHWSGGSWNVNNGEYYGDDTYGTPKHASVVACRDELKNTFYIYSLVPPQRCNNAYCAIEV